MLTRSPIQSPIRRVTRGYLPGRQPAAFLPEGQACLWARQRTSVHVTGDYVMNILEKQRIFSTYRRVVQKVVRRDEFSRLCIDKCFKPMIF